MVILPGIRVIVRRFLCIERRFLSDWSKKFYVDVLAQCAVYRPLSVQAYQLSTPKPRSENPKRNHMRFEP